MRDSQVSLAVNLNSSKANQFKNPAHTLLEGITHSDISLSPEEKYCNEEMFWHSTCTEYDSKRFYKKIKLSKLKISHPLELFLNKWLQDEISHANGFIKIYSTIYNQDEVFVREKLDSRLSDFSMIDDFFEDEFKLCLLLAYDEIVTTHVYHRSIPFYENIGSSKFGLWIKRIKTDEARHFVGVIKILQKYHGSRRSEVEKILNEIIKIDSNIEEYKATFVLDHSCPEFPLSQDELTSICVKTILMKLRQKG